MKHHTQIHVPPELPEILKQFTKTAIQVHPPDVLAWSAAYFRALASGEAKDSRWRNRKTNLTPSLLRVLNKQLGPLKSVPLTVIYEKWSGLALPQEEFDALVRADGLIGEVEWTAFLSGACFSISQSLTDAMTLACDVLTTESDGRVPFMLFMSIYRQLASKRYNVSGEHVDYIGGYLYDNFAKKQNGYIMPRNFLRADYPGLSGSG